MLPVILPAILAGLFLSSCNRSNSKSGELSPNPSPEPQASGASPAVSVAPATSAPFPSGSSFESKPPVFREITEPRTGLLRPIRYAKPEAIRFWQWDSPKELSSYPLMRAFETNGCVPVSKNFELKSGLLKISLDPVLSLDLSCKYYLLKIELGGQVYEDKGGKPTELLTGDFDGDGVRDLAIGLDPRNGILFRGIATAADAKPSGKVNTGPTPPPSWEF